ncbi:hypothetical protein [Streptomyces sp. NPDC002550]
MDHGLALAGEGSAVNGVLVEVSVDKAHRQAAAGVLLGQVLDGQFGGADRVASCSDREGTPDGDPGGWMNGGVGSDFWVVRWLSLSMCAG